MSGQVRVLIEGINTTEGTGGAGFYFDYASLEEAFIGTSGQSAEMPNPGVQSQFIARSGSNTFQGEYHLDWYNNSLQGSNIPAEYTASTAFNGSNGSNAIRPSSNEIQKYYDHDINLGGPILKDKIWIFGTYREQFNAVSQPQFTFDSTFNTKLWNPVGKLTYQVNPKNKIIGYYQWGQKEQPNRLPFGTYTYTSPEQTNLQDSGSWVYKGEWNSTISDKVYLEARYGDFGYYFPLISNSSANFSFRDSGLARVEGANQVWQLDRDRKQYNLASTYFLDTAKGSHTFKAGGELLKERSWEGYLQQYGGNIDHVYSNGVSNTVSFTFPTATDAGKLSAHDKLTAIANLDQIGLFINDTWAIGRATINAGFRYDRYKGWLPEQEQLPGSLAQWAPQFPTLANQVTAKSFPETTFYTWNQFAPRIGVTFDLTGDGKTVLKGNYGLYWHNPGVGVGGSQLSDTMGMRAGFVYKTEDDLIATYQPLRGPSAFTVPYSFTDIGVDGRAGTSDDKTLTFYGMPNAQAANFSNRQVVMNVDQYSRYKTYEVSMNKRYGNKWSASMGYGFTQMTDFPNGPARNPNNPGVQDRTIWNFKASGSYDAPFGIRLSPVVRHQSGANYARVLTISAPAALALTATSASPSGSPASSGTNAYAEPMNANREDNIAHS